MAIVELRCIVKGIVQGVSFRALARKTAMGLGITGTVQNLSDGSVEIHAQGTVEALEEFMHSLKKLPHPVRIDSYTTEFHPVKQKYESFSVKF